MSCIFSAPLGSHLVVVSELKDQLIVNTVYSYYFYYIFIVHWFVQEIDQVSFLISFSTLKIEITGTLFFLPKTYFRFRLLLAEKEMPSSF